MTRTLILQLVDWKEQGKLEYRSDFGGWHGRAEFSTHEKFEDFRIKPTPTLRPWRPEEVPVGAIISGNNLTSNSMLIVECVGSGGVNIVRFGRVDKIPFVELTDFSYSLDHGKTWLPCGVME